MPVDASGFAGLSLTQIPTVFAQPATRDLLASALIGLHSLGDVAQQLIPQRDAAFGRFF